MSLRQKVITLVLAIVALLLAALYVFSRTVMLSSYSSLEEREERRNAERVLQAIATSLGQIAKTAGDYAMWDDTYEFIAGRMPEYLDKNMTPAAFANLGIGFMAFVDAESRMVWSGALSDDKIVHLSPAANEILRRQQRLTQHAREDAVVSGLLRLPEGVALVAARPIIKSDGSGPIRGSTIFGRMFDEEETKRLAELTRLSLIVKPIATLPDDFRAAQAEMRQNRERVVIKPLSDVEVASYVEVEDLEGKPALMLRITSARDIFRQGQQAMVASLVAIFASGLVLGLAIILVLERTVLDRLMRLSEGAMRISEQKDLATRFPVAGRDELAMLSQHINEMLAALQRFQQEQIRLRKMEAMVVLAQGIAHDFNNALAAIVGNIGLAQKKAGEGSPAAAFLKEAVEGCDDIKRLVLRLLAFARGEGTGRQQFALAPTVERALVRAGQTYRGHVQTEIAIAEDSRTINADADQIAEALYHLVANAFEAMPTGGKIRVAAERVAITPQSSLPLPGGIYHRITVSDNGAGIPPEHADKIFDPYFTTHEKGRGMGLALCYAIASMHNGYLAVKSQPGKGTDAELYLPADDGKDAN